MLASFPIGRCRRPQDFYSDFILLFIRLSCRLATMSMLMAWIRAIEVLKFSSSRRLRFGAAMSCSSGLCLRRFLGGALRPTAKRYDMSWFAGPPRGADVRR